MLLVDADPTRAVALGDMAGDPDAFLGTVSSSFPILFSLSGEQTRAYSHLTHQISWRDIPRTGEPPVLSVRGPRSGIRALSASPGSVAVPFPPFRTPRLHPLSPAFVGSGVVDPQGRAGLSIPAPPDPARIGFPLPRQAAFGQPHPLQCPAIPNVTSLHPYLELQCQHQSWTPMTETKGACSC